MKKLACMSGVFALLLNLPLVLAAEVRDSTVADPDVHQVVLENEHVRVIEAMAAPGYKSPMHSHPGTLIVSVSTARLKVKAADGKTQILDLKPGQVVWLDGAQHSWELLSGNLHAVAVEVKAARRQ